MLKAAAGGGGRGMRLVESPEALTAALELARTEAEHAFGWAELLLEKALLAPRHVEVQIFGDAFGTLVHLDAQLAGGPGLGGADQCAVLP